MSTHPYRNLPDWAFWRRAVADTPAAELDPLIAAPFKIQASDRIATAGSCFAQHIARHLRESGFTSLVTETAHPIVPAAAAEEFGYGLYTARYGNIYTSRQLVQLFQRAYGTFSPQDDVWAGPEGQLVDPFRPNIQPGGFQTLEEYRADRLRHMACVREAFETLDIFVFTLGLTECWRSRVDGAAYPLCPGVAGGEYDPERHEFVNLTAQDVTSDLETFAALLEEVNPAARIIVTVSPVPLIATVSDRHVLAATTYSKSVLRVAAEQFTAARPNATYFPSYEIITGSFNRGAYFASDLRSVTEEGVAHVMRCFMRHFTDAAIETAPRNPVPADDRQTEEMRQLVRVVCDEEMQDSGAVSHPPAQMAASKPFRMAIFTICSNNYVPAARTFLESARRHHPEAHLFLCLADRMLDEPAFYDAAWTVVAAEELEIPDFLGFAFRYDIMEMNTAVKPFMFRHLFDKLGYDAALYFDPDIEIFRPLTQIVEQLHCGASFALTPHLCAPSEEAGEPNDFTIMRAGVYNLGFLGVGNTDESRPLLDWWARRLRYTCINAQDRGIFVDQKFMDLVPGFAPRAFICHDVSHNVAYWNLRQRRVEWDGKGPFTVNGEALTFFHYSGFDPRKPRQLSKHDQAWTGALPEALATLLAGYAERLLERGYGTVPAATYAYGRFASGTVIHPFIREMFREGVKTWPDSPFETFESYLHEPLPGASRAIPGYTVTNFVAFLHQRFPYLSGRLRLNEPEHVRELVDWYVTHSADELGFDRALIEPVTQRMGMVQPSGRAAPQRDGTAQVTVIGYLRAASGVGEVGRQTLLTLAAGGMAVEGVDVALNVLTARDDRRCDPFLTEAAQAPVQIYNVNADQLALVVADVAPRVQANAVRINVPFWELSRFPAPWLPHFAAMDEIWAPSRFIQSALAGRIAQPVLYMPVAIEVEPPPVLERARFGLPERTFLFFFAFDLMSFPERKNPKAVIAAFLEAFPSTGQAGLVLKCLNGAHVPAAFAALKDQIGGHPDIVLVDETLSHAETLGLLAVTDAVVSLHRSEGLGLLIAEAMLLGKPVIATDYSASREFLSQQTGYPVGYTLIPLREGDYPFWQGQRWAAPDQSHAAWLMRALLRDPTRARDVVARARAHLQTNFSRQRVAAQQIERLRLLAGQGAI